MSKTTREGHRFTGQQQVPQMIMLRWGYHIQYLFYPLAIQTAKSDRVESLVMNSSHERKPMVPTAKCKYYTFDQPSSRSLFISDLWRNLLWVVWCIFFLKGHNSSESTPRKQEVRVEPGDLRSRNRVCKMSERKTLYGLKFAVTMIIIVYFLCSCCFKLGET